MIRKLQKRFVKIAVLALTLAMVLVVVIVNAANLVSVRNELAGTLRLRAENIVPAEPPAEMANPGKTGWNREAGKSADGGNSGENGDAGTAVKGVDDLDHADRRRAARASHRAENLAFASVGKRVQRGERADIVEVRVHVRVEDDLLRRSGRDQSGAKGRHCKEVSSFHAPIIAQFGAWCLVLGA